MITINQFQPLNHHRYRDLFNDQEKAIEVCMEGLADNPETNKHWIWLNSDSTDPPPNKEFIEKCYYKILGSVKENQGDIAGALRWYEFGSDNKLHGILVRVLNGEVQYDNPNFSGMMRHKDSPELEGSTEFRHQLETEGWWTTSFFTHVHCGLFSSS